jgi:ketosteroid isomerase-like protein
MRQIVRWEITPADRHARSFDERVRLVAPSFSRRLARLVMSKPAGSRLRTQALTKSICSSFAANNRNDYDVLVSALHPEAELIPPGRSQGGLGFAAVYHGPDGVREFVQQWKSGFSEWRYEPREIADGGGAHFAVRVGMIGTFAGSGGEVRDEYGTLYTLDDGLVRRMENFYEWEDALGALEAAANARKD